MNDWRGTEIRVGSTIVYAVTKSSTITMVEAIVDEIIEEEVPFWDYYNKNEEGKPTQGIRIKVSIKARRRMEHRGQPKGIQKVQLAYWGYLPVYDKKVTLTAVERLVVIPEIG